MHYTLRGTIAKAHPYQLDKTLTVEGAGAEAKATGEAIKEVAKHAERIDNPHKVTAKQIGLDRVDNTSDMDKPVSTAQREAIDVVREAVRYAQQAADNGCVAADKAQEKADNAQTRADNAYELANSKSSANAVMLSLDKSMWSDNTQLITVDGLNVTDVVFLWPHSLDSEEYFKCGVYGYLQGDGSITFKCKEVPTDNLSVHCAYITLGGTE